MCWCLSTHFYVLAFGTLLLGFQHTSAGLLQPPDSAMDNLHLCTPICPEDRLSTTFCFSYAQVHPLRNLSIGALQYECTGEIFLEERSFGVGREGGPATRLTAERSCKEPGAISHSLQRSSKSSAAPARCSFIAKPNLVSVKHPIPIS